MIEVQRGVVYNLQDRTPVERSAVRCMRRASNDMLKEGTLDNDYVEKAVKVTFSTRICMASIKTSPERRLTGLRLTHIAGFVCFWSVTAVHGRQGSFGKKRHRGSKGTWIQSGWARTSVLTVDESEESKSVLTSIWEERVGLNHTNIGLCTAQAFGCVLEIMDAVERK